MQKSEDTPLFGRAESSQLCSRSLKSEGTYIAHRILEARRDMAGSSANIQEEASAAFDETAMTHSNLRCFLDSVTPVVKAQPYLPLVSMP